MAKIAPEHTPDDFDEMFDKDSVDWRDRAPAKRSAERSSTLPSSTASSRRPDRDARRRRPSRARLVSPLRAPQRDHGAGRRIGDRLGIRYEGEKPSKRGPKPYHSYTVMHRPRKRTSRHMSLDP